MDNETTNPNVTDCMDVTASLYNTTEDTAYAEDTAQTEDITLTEGTTQARDTTQTEEGAQNVGKATSQTDIAQCCKTYVSHDRQINGHIYR